MKMAAAEHPGRPSADRLGFLAVYLKLTLQFVLSLGIGAFFLWLTIDGLVADAGGYVEGSFWASLQHSLASVPLGTLAAYVLIFLIVHIVRIHRWQYLVTPLGERDTRKIFRICAVGFTAIVILPLRLGEMVRPYMLSRESGVPMSAALGTAVVERVLDGLLITGLLFLSLATYDGAHSTGFVTGTAYVALAVFAGALSLLILAAARHDWTVHLLRATLGRLNEKLCNAVINLVDGFLDGVRVLRREHVLLRFLGVTVLYWGLNGLGIAVLAHGFGFPVTLWQAYGLLSILVLGIMIPAGPGFFGNFQFFLSQGLLLFFSSSVVASAGLAFGLTLNTIQFVVMVGFGIPFFLMSHVAARKLLRGGMMRRMTPESRS
jgi:uncharacterized protein (TIRG00374 family)